MKTEAVPLLRSLIEKHKGITPGEWLYRPMEETRAIRAADGGMLAQIGHLVGRHGSGGWRRKPEEAASNARAIADLPAMLDAMRAAVLELEEVQDVHGMVKEMRASGMTGISHEDGWTIVESTVLEAMRENDARYRWLREFGADWWKAGIVSQLGSLGDIPCRLHSTTLDTAIDAARSAPLTDKGGA